MEVNALLRNDAHRLQDIVQRLTERVHGEIGYFEDTINRLGGGLLRIHDEIGRVLAGLDNEYNPNRQLAGLEHPENELRREMEHIVQYPDHRVRGVGRFNDELTVNVEDAADIEPDDVSWEVISISSYSSSDAEELIVIVEDESDFEPVDVPWEVLSISSYSSSDTEELDDEDWEEISVSIQVSSDSGFGGSTSDISQTSEFSSFSEELRHNDLCHFGFIVLPEMVQEHDRHYVMAKDNINDWLSEVARANEKRSGLKRKFMQYGDDDSDEESGSFVEPLRKLCCDGDIMGLLRECHSESDILHSKKRKLNVHTSASHNNVYNQNTNEKCRHI